ncbi:MAG: SusC/RagA family TonB-linked outer membrane protein [Gemmatimonadaceae bacterium]
MVKSFARLLTAGWAVLLCVATIGNAQEPTIISGNVRSDAGNPIPQATVFIQSLSIAVQTRDDGSYRLAVPANKLGAVTMAVRRLGYVEVKTNLTVGSAPMTQDFVMKASVAQLTGVVVTALSLQREKSTIGTSQQEISSQELTRTHDANIVNQLSGKVSGVTITGGGNIGGSSRIVIRGASSINGNNQPLFVVDGVALANTNFNDASTASANGGTDFGNAIQDLNPDDIASITVLKGPNAAALYGYRAANGAVIITTKSGRGGQQGTRTTFSSYYTADSFSRLPAYQNLYGQGAGGQFDFVDGAGGGTQDGNDQSFGPRLDGTLRNQFNGKNLPFMAHPNNVKDYFNTGGTLTNNISITSVSGPASARLSVSNEQVKGIIPNSALGKTTASLNADVNVNNQLTVGGTLQYIANRGLNRPGTGYNVSPLEQFIWFGRQVDTKLLKDEQYDANGNLYNWNYNFHNNPYWLQKYNPESDERDRIVASANATYQFLPWLKGLARFGTDAYHQSINQNWAQGNLVYADPTYAGAFNLANYRSVERSGDGILTANRAFGRLELTGNFGGTIERNSLTNNSIATAGLSVPGIYNVSNAAITPTVTNNETRTGVNSMFGSAVATFNGYFTVEATGRNDWSSTLPKENASYFYPSFSSSLILSDLFPAIQKGHLTYLKLRGGHAQVGAPANAYQLQTTYTGLSTKFGSLPLFGLSNTIANATLKPERTTGDEGGLEFAFGGDRVVFDGSYYNKITKDQIINLTVAPATGFSSVAVNAGQISNRGYEAQVSVKPLKSNRGLNWTSTFNYGRNRSKVDALTGNLQTVILGSNWSVNVEARKGQPYGVLFGAPYMRDSASGKLLLRNGLPQADVANRRVLGNYNPDWTGGWSNDFRFRNVGFSFLLDIRQGGQIFSSGNMFATYSGVLASTIAGRDVAWDKPGLVVAGIDSKTGQPNTTNVTAEDYYQSLYGIHEAFVSPAGFVKLREVRLSFDFPTGFTDRLRIKGANIALVGRNLWMHTKFPNFDPENAYSSGNVQGFDFASTPTTKSYGINVTITP